MEDLVSFEKKVLRNWARVGARFFSILFWIFNIFNINLFL